MPVLQNPKHERFAQELSKGSCRPYGLASYESGIHACANESDVEPNAQIINPLGKRRELHGIVGGCACVILRTADQSGQRRHQSKIRYRYDL
jgi:hypothetical protein